MLPTLDHVDVSHKTVLVRLDLNVPMQAGRITDTTRIVRSIPTLQYLISRHAKVVILSHLGRPKGKVDFSLSLAPLVDTLSEMLWDRPVRFCPDAIGRTAELAVENADYGDAILMENLRFHPEEEANDPDFARALASLGDVYVNEAFSSCHRAHASVAAIAQYLPSVAGKLMEEELTALNHTLENPQRPLGAVVGGAKVSSKIELLNNLVSRVDKLLIGGAMAHTFLLAQGYSVGTSLVERDMTTMAEKIIANAKAHDCELLLPEDAVVAESLHAQARCEVVPVSAIPANQMMLDTGPQSLLKQADALAGCKTIVWNGPLGAFETSPFDASTITLARQVAALSRAGQVHSVAGGGDTVAALARAGLKDQFSYLSTAGGAFLEWLEGKELPGLTALYAQKKSALQSAG